MELAMFLHNCSLLHAKKLAKGVKCSSTVSLVCMVMTGVDAKVICGLRYCELTGISVLAKTPLVSVKMQVGATVILLV